MPEDGSSDQLFIRVPGYRDILEDVAGVQQILVNMRKSVEVLQDVQDVKRQSVEVFNENVERLNARLKSMDEEFPEVQDIEAHVERGDGEQVDVDMGDDIIDESVQELRDELEGLKNELGSIE